MSQIVASGTLSITGAAVNNRQLTVTADSTRVGTAYTWKQYDEGCGNIKGCTYNYQAYGGCKLTSRKAPSHKAYNEIQ